LVELDAPWNFDFGDLDAVQLTEVWAYHRDHAPVSDRYRPAVAQFVGAAREFTDAQLYLAAQARRVQGAQRWEHWFCEHGVDLVLEPTMSIVPYERGPGYDGDRDTGADDPMIGLTAFCLQWLPLDRFGLTATVPCLC